MGYASAAWAAKRVVFAGLLVLAGCGGGGGSGGGPPNGPYLTVSPTQVVLAVSGDTSSTPSTTINVTLHNGSASGTYLGASFTRTAITALTFSASGNTGVLTATFTDPSTIAPGVYKDTINVSICADSSCASIQPGTTVSIPIQYTVTLDATVSLSASPTTVGAGTPTVLTWSSTHAQSCTASGEWSGALPPSGTQNVTPATLGVHSYGISCSNPGAPAQASLTVTAVAPSVVLTAFPTTVTLGRTVTLRWQGDFSTGCTASGDWSGSLPPSGAVTLTPVSIGTTNYHLVCSNAAASDQKDVAVTTISASTLVPATAYRINEAHDGVLITASGATTPSQTTPIWTRNLGAPVSYPLVANGRVYVATANPDGSYGNQLYALDATSGATVWGPIAVPGTYFGSGITYENGRIYLLMFDGVLHAFDATTGAPKWATQLPGYWYDATPNASGGTVFVSGNAGLSAIDEGTGTILWTAGSGGTTDWASPAVASSGVFMQEGYGCTASAFDPQLGTVLWQTQHACNSPWGYASVIKNNVFYGRVGSGLDLFNALTGTFNTQIGSSSAPSITSTAIITRNSSILSATRTSDLVQIWTFTGDGGLITAPVVVNTTAYIGSSSGNVYGVDTATGTQVWVGVAPAGINGDSENGGPMPPSGPTAGENLLIFISGTSLVAWPLP
ncbi:MAG: PQQ-like beta-propeller repeat protein [Proteobacteria bacterium]|nr:PQQ-like beta-propeller repeat protein [Pseudomonadota bacterium]